MKKAFTLLVLLYSVTCYAQLEKKYVTADYSIKYPAAWKLDDTKKLAAAIFFYSPLENSEDKFSENVNIMIQSLKGQPVDLEKFKSTTEEQVNTLAAEGKINSSKIEKGKYGERYSIEYQMTMNSIALVIKTICYIKNNNAYIITFTTKADTWEQYRQTGVAMLESFTLK